jgi:hypothetical protein
MPRMTPMDRAFFLLETEQRPMNVGVLVVVAPPPADAADFQGGKPTRRSRGRPRVRPADELVRRMLRCPVGAPFNYVLAPGRWPQLVERRDLDPGEQVFRHRLAAGSDVQALFTRVCALHSRRLDRARPLWEMHVFEGLADGRVGLYFKCHHGLLDGLGFLRVIRDTVSHGPGGSAPQAIWRGLPATSDGKPSSPAVTHPASRGVASLRAGLAVPLARVRSVARAANAKVNDVLLAMLDVALGRRLAQQGTTPGRPLIVDMPVALHDDDCAGNRITILQVPLGRPGGSPSQRLADIVRETRAVKAEVRALSPNALFYYSIAEHTLASAIETLGLDELPMLANAVVSNPTGLAGRVWFNGFPVELALPVSVVAHHQTLNVTITNYADDLHVTFIAVREALPDVQVLADDTARALGDLARSVRAPAGAPARRRTGRGTRRSSPSASAATLH